MSNVKNGLTAKGNTLNKTMDFFYLNKPQWALENSLNTQILISLQVNNTQYKCEIDAWILNFFIASELYIYWDKILRLLAPTIEIS